MERISCPPSRSYCRLSRGGASRQDVTVCLRRRKRGRHPFLAMQVASSYGPQASLWQSKPVPESTITTAEICHRSNVATALPSLRAIDLCAISRTHALAWAECSGEDSVD